MSDYWDSSALVECAVNEALRDRLKAQGGVTRTHALSEVFSALTAGNLALRVEANEAADFVESLATDLRFVDLSSTEIVLALKKAQSKGVRGGRVHDYLHMAAAEKGGCS